MYTISYRVRACICVHQINTRIFHIGVLFVYKLHLSIHSYNNNNNNRHHHHNRHNNVSHDKTIYRRRDMQIYELIHH